MLTERSLKIDRDISPAPLYGGSKKYFKMLHPELQLSGPQELGPPNLEFHACPYPEISRGWISQRSVYAYIMKQGIIARCLNSRDAEHIMSEGIEIFSKLFTGKKVCIWKSVLGFITNNTPVEVQVLYFGKNKEQPTLYYENLDNICRTEHAIVLYR